jgi:hypothetical protein
MLDRFQSLKDRGRKWQQVFDLIGSGSYQNDRELPVTGRLLAGYSLIDREQDIVARNLGSPEQFAILLTFQTRPLNGVGLMAGKVVPEIQSLASSSASTAISRVTEGN